MNYIASISHIIVTVVAVGALAVKVEHRLTKIETEITWIKQRLDKLCNPGIDTQETEQ